MESLEPRRLLARPAAIAAPTIPSFFPEELETNVSRGSGVFTTAGVVGTNATFKRLSSFADNTYRLTGRGAGIGGSSDSFTFASLPAISDGSIVVRVTALTGTGGSPRAGVMIRSSLDGSAAFAGVLVTSSGVSFVRRLTDGAPSSQSALPGVSPPRFLKLTRDANTVSGFYSSDGVSWTQVGTTITMSLGTNPRVGLAATASSTTATASATFANVAVLLPLGTEANDIGTTSTAAGVSYSTGTNLYTLTTSAVDALGTGDELGFVHRPMLSSASLTARIEHIARSPRGAAAGLALRGSLAPGSAFAMLTMSNEGRVEFRWRATAGGAVSVVGVDGLPIHSRLKLEREGNVVSPFFSTDGTSWSALGAGSAIAFPSSRVLGGMVVRSTAAGATVSASFSGFGQLSKKGDTMLDIGLPANLGSGLFDTVRNTHTLVGRGGGVSMTDELTFAGRTLTGDGDVAAYVSGFFPANASARAGIVLRASAAPDAPFAGVFLSSAGLIIQSRGFVGAPLSSSVVSSVNGPVSLRLVRVGNAVTARLSIDGNTWVPVGGTRTVSLGTSPLAGMAVASGSGSGFTSANFTGFATGTRLPTGAGVFTPADETFLNDLQARSVQFFWSETNPGTGLVPDGSLASGGGPSAVSSIASVGFGLSALALADERGFLSHADAYQRALTTVNFLYTNAAHVNGFFYHFMNPATGARSPGSELSPMDTALLMAGVLDVAEHWSGTPLATTATALYERVEWDWMLKPNGHFYGHWTPEAGFEFGYGDFSEAVLIYLLGLGSPTHPIPTSSWNSWLRSPTVTYSGITFVTAQTRALFTVQYPMGWFDLRGKTDAFGLSYFDNAQRATLAQRAMGINMAGTYPRWGANLWGWTAADGPTGYTVWGGPPATSNIDGSVVPTAPGGSLAFTPRQSVDALRNMQATYPSTYRRYGFVDAFNPQTNWNSAIVLGIDVGMMLLAAENARSGAIWSRFMDSAAAQTALTRAFGAARTAAVEASDDLSLLTPMRAEAPPRVSAARRIADGLFSDSTLD